MEKGYRFSTTLTMNPTGLLVKGMMVWLLCCYGFRENRFRCVEKISFSITTYNQCKYLIYSKRVVMSNII